MSRYQTGSKGKRGIVVDEVPYNWDVKWDDDWYPENTILIFDREMRPIIRYTVGTDRTRVFGQWLSSPGWIASNGRFDSRRVPAVTPGIVAEIIRWSVSTAQ